MFTLHGFECEGKEHLALTYGDIGSEDSVLLRIHSECLTGDALFSIRCDCGKQLEGAMRSIVEAGKGVVLYLRQEGRGIGLLNKLRAYALQDLGLDTVDANIALGLPVDSRNYGVSKGILDYFGVKNIRLMTNNLDKVNGLTKLGFNIVERVPHSMGRCESNERYLVTKANRCGHVISL